jgi:hypothetical protein
MQRQKNNEERIQEASNIGQSCTGGGANVGLRGEDTLAGKLANHSIFSQCQTLFIFFKALTVCHYNVLQN